MTRLKHTMLVLMVLALTVLFASPAFAQTGDIPASAAVNAGVTVAFLALVVQYVLEWLRGRWQSLDGDLLRVLALVIGYGAAYAYDLDVAAEFGFEGLPTALGYLVAAFVIAGLSGVISSGKNALRSRDPLSDVPPPR